MKEINISKDWLKKLLWFFFFSIIINLIIPFCFGSYFCEVKTTPERLKEQQNSRQEIYRNVASNMEWCKNNPPISDWNTDVYYEDVVESINRLPYDCKDEWYFSYSKDWMLSDFQEETIKNQLRDKKWMSWMQSNPPDLLDFNVFRLSYDPIYGKKIYKKHKENFLDFRINHKVKSIPFIHPVYKINPSFNLKLQLCLMSLFKNFSNIILLTFIISILDVLVKFLKNNFKIRFK